MIVRTMPNGETECRVCGPVPRLYRVARRRKTNGLVDLALKIESFWDADSPYDDVYTVSATHRLTGYTSIGQGYTEQDAQVNALEALTELLKTCCWDRDISRAAFR